MAGREIDPVLVRCYRDKLIAKGEDGLYVFQCQYGYTFDHNQMELITEELWYQNVYRLMPEEDKEKGCLSPPPEPRTSLTLNEWNTLVDGGPIGVVTLGPPVVFHPFTLSVDSQPKVVEPIPQKVHWMKYLGDKIFAMFGVK